ncbi:MAG: hypothetical protein KBA60_08230 [Flavobacteriales bacterium]|nr:hypothetical protein [Flavobacteriales bacterium]MBP6642369.1 hypothetical protein [Flavobacteriales bacterium]MBP7155980.1 hypothetical protein [Flavobacteriales bacterium]HQV75148.1 hypothetical protein [Flavobacteriales bacterium]HQW40790.1 hypothetical protein [Flavobacteriales bacterium]
MRVPIHMFLLLVLVLLLGNSHAQDSSEPLTLPIAGKVADSDDHKLQGCEVLIFKGNDLVGQQLTERNGRFTLELGLGEEFSMEFRMEGYLPKRILVDTRADLPKDLLGIAPVEIDMHMMPASKYNGADTDELDFPFAIVAWDKRAQAFVQDREYTTDMMRTNGALLLMSGRAAVKK